MNITLSEDHEAELKRRAKSLGVSPQALAEAYVRERLKNRRTPASTQPSGDTPVSRKPSKRPGRPPKEIRGGW